MLEAHRQRRPTLREALHRDLRRGTDRPGSVLEPHQLREVAERADLHLHQPIEQLPRLALGVPVRLRANRDVRFLVLVLHPHPLDRGFEPTDQPLARFAVIALGVRDPLRHRRGLPKGPQANPRRLRPRLTAHGLQIVGERRKRPHRIAIAVERRLKLLPDLAQLLVAMDHHGRQARRHELELLDPPRRLSGLGAARLQLSPLGAHLRLRRNDPLPRLPKRVVTSDDRLIARRNRLVDVVRVIPKQPLPEHAVAPRPAAAVPAGGSAHDGANARPRVGRTRTAVPCEDRAMPFPERVETERLILRRWTPADGPAMKAIWAERDIWRAIRPDIPFDSNQWRDMLDRQLEHWKHHGFGLWAAAERASGEVIGWIGPSHPAFIPELADRIEIGWTMRPPFWGRGLATEGAAAAVDVAFAHLETDAVISLIHHTNQRSIAVATRLGMRYSRDVLHPELGEDLRVYALSRSAWSSSSSRGASAQSTSSR